MCLFEKNYVKLMRKITNKLRLKRLLENTETILDKNFSYSILQLMQFEPKRIKNTSKRHRSEDDSILYDLSTPVSAQQEEMVHP